MLGGQFGVTYVPSAAVLALLRSRPAPATGISVFADPEVDLASAPIAGLDAERRGAVGSALPGAREEGGRMRALGASVHLGRDASLEHVRRARASAVLHFATHALDDHGDATRGGLVLAGADALLTPAAIESLHVAADLVTLAACSTLGSHADLGEGPRGLARAFLVSGARSVVTTRWEVSDRAAARFMREFYAGLRVGDARDSALGQARGRMLAEGFAPRDCWAFSLTGVGDESVVALAPRGKSGALAK
jgi:CHAT domain-containing protein